MQPYLHPFQQMLSGESRFLTFLGCSNHLSLSPLIPCSVVKKAKWGPRVSSLTGGNETPSSTFNGIGGDYMKHLDTHAYLALE